MLVLKQQPKPRAQGEKTKQKTQETVTEYRWGKCENNKP